jgi:hypothetical protein
MGASLCAFLAASSCDDGQALFTFGGHPLTAEQAMSLIDVAEHGKAWSHTNDGRSHGGSNTRNKLLLRWTSCMLPASMMHARRSHPVVRCSACYPVCYRGIPVASIMCNMVRASSGSSWLLPKSGSDCSSDSNSGGNNNSISDDESNIIYMLMGYSTTKDCFVYLNVRKAPFDVLANRPSNGAADQPCCMICHEPLHTDDVVKNIVTRVYTQRCFHDMHMQCHAELRRRRMTVAQCCRGVPATATYHLRVCGYSQVQLRGTCGASEAERLAAKAMERHRRRSAMRHCGIPLHVMKTKSSSSSSSSSSSQPDSTSSSYLTPYPSSSSSKAMVAAGVISLHEHALGHPGNLGRSDRSDDRGATSHVVWMRKARLLSPDESVSIGGDVAKAAMLVAERFSKKGPFIPLRSINKIHLTSHYHAKTWCAQ